MDGASVSTVAVTGASGFLGSALLRHFALDPVLRLRALTRTIGEQLVRTPNASWMQGDLASPLDCADFVRGAEVIVHLAHVNTPLVSDAHLASDAASNMVPFLTLLQAIREAGTRPHIVFPSSGGAIYRAPTDRRTVPETAVCEPITSYGIQKLAAEHYLRMAAEQGWLTATVLRIGNPYGVLLPRERRQGFIGVAVNQVLHGRPVRLFGDEHNVRDYVHLDDVCRAFEAVAGKHGTFDVYNVGSGVGHSVAHILELLAEVIGRPIEVEREEPTESAQRLPAWIVLDVAKARVELGWEPQITLEEGIERLYAESVVRT